MLIKQSNVERTKFWQDALKRQAESGLNIKDYSAKRQKREYSKKQRRKHLKLNDLKETKKILVNQKSA